MYKRREAMSEVYNFSFSPIVLCEKFNPVKISTNAYEKSFFVKKSSKKAHLNFFQTRLKFLFNENLRKLFFF